MKNKAKLNYIVDIIIGLGFIAATVSGLVLLTAGSGGGYQGGRNPAYSRELWLFTRFQWKDIHNWSGILMALGVLGHLVLHWNWMVCMTKNIFKRKKQPATNCTA